MWAHDYCTVCDKQCAPGSMYCSDSCRASELIKSHEISSSSNKLYSTLYTTCRRQSLTSPACDDPQCSSSTCLCADLDSSCSSYPSTPEMSPAYSASSPISIRSVGDKYDSKHSVLSSLPPSPLMIPTGYFSSMQKGHSEFTNTSINYRRWLSAV